MRSAEEPERIRHSGQSNERARKRPTTEPFTKCFVGIGARKKNNTTTAALVAQDGHEYDTLGRFQDERAYDSLLFTI